MIAIASYADLDEAAAALLGVLRKCDAVILEDFFQLFSNTPMDVLAEFFDYLFKPAYVPVVETTKHVAELRLILPAEANERLAALRAYQANNRR
jgi:hypothetical protein